MDLNLIAVFFSSALNTLIELIAQAGALWMRGIVL